MKSTLPSIEQLEARALATVIKTMLDECITPNHNKGGYWGLISIIPLFKLDGYSKHRYWHIMETYQLIPAHTLDKEEIEDLREVISIIIADCSKPKLSRKLINPATGDIVHLDES
tara:strand:+ start:3986 stop:4330 length:345 start_codon:yes stop_codon:yes gene_type:complete